MLFCLLLSSLLVELLLLFPVVVEEGQIFATLQQGLMMVPKINVGGGKSLLTLLLLLDVAGAEIAGGD